MIRRLSKWWRRLRSSATGRFLTREQYDKLHPGTTAEEEVQRKIRKLRKDLG